MANRFELPNLGFGIGLRTVHYQHILTQKPRIDWFEVLSDNYMNTRGRPLWYLDRVREQYPVALHGVGLSIGSSDPLSAQYLKELRELRDRTGAAWVSDHLCWTGVAGRFGHDLYPLPYTEETLRHVVGRVKHVQDSLGAPLVLENPSTYLQYRASQMSEPEFLSRLVVDADAAILLDVNNVYVNANNHGFDPFEYLEQLPLERVVQFHVAGHSVAEGYLADTHDGPVIGGVWDLLRHAYRLGARAALIMEWDADIPEFDAVLAQAERGRLLLAEVQAEARDAAVGSEVLPWR